MDFYIGISLLSLVVLIILLIWFWYISSYSKPTAAFPGFKNTCPDYWKLDAATGKCIVNNSNNKGITDLKLIPVSATSESADKTTKYIDFNDSAWRVAIPGLNNPVECNLTAWSNKNNLLWDGVSNYASCEKFMKRSSEGFTGDDKMMEGYSSATVSNTTISTLKTGKFVKDANGKIAVLDR